MVTGTSIAGWLATLAVERPSDPAVIDGGAIATWADLHAATAAIAGHPRLVPSDGTTTVGLVAAPSAAAIAVVHTALGHGLRLVALHPRAAGPELASLVRRGRVGALAVDRADAHRLPADLGVPVLALDELTGPSGSTPMTAPGATRGPGEIVVPTSGTTGRPRLAILSAANLAASATAWATVLPPATGWLLSLGLGHVAGIGIVVRAASAGVPVVVPASNDPTGMLDAIRRADAAGIGVSHLSLVAVQLARVLDHTRDAPPPRSVRAVLLGGGPIPPALVTRALGAGWPVIPTYGLTETASGVTALPTSQAADAPWSAGRALHGAEVRVCDPEDPASAPLPAGRTGELRVRGPMVFAGYAGDPDATAARLAADGWLRSGDLGRIDEDGLVAVIDRIDDLIVSGGENVAPAEIEAVLGTHPDVADAGVIGAADRTWSRVPVAAVVARPGRTLDPDELRAFVRERLAPFKVPARVVVTSALPRTASGKLLRRELVAVVGAGRSATVLPDVRLAVIDRPGPPGASTVLLLHATLATAASLRPLATALVGDARILAADRRGSGRTPLEPVGPVSVGTHVADTVRVLDDAGVDRAVVAGHSFGGVIGLELAARHPDRVAGVLAWEPPYLALADAAIRAHFDDLPARLLEARRTGGPEAAARLFFDAVNRPGAFDALPPGVAAAVAVQGDGALADTAMPDLEPDGLARIDVPVVIATGGRDDPLYGPIASALVRSIPTARRVDLQGRDHLAPLTGDAAIVELIRELVRGAFPRGRSG